MKCPKCQAELPEDSVRCRFCGHRFGSENNTQFHSDSRRPADEEQKSNNVDAKRALKPLSGFRRTLSTELVERQTELRIIMELNELVENRIYEPGEVLIHKGDTNRDLLFLTEGSVEISTPDKNGNLVLNEIEPPYILGDIAFLSGFPRTATAKAKTRVETFILKYENLRNLYRDFPEWLDPLLTSFASAVKSLHFRIADLKREVQELAENKEQ